MPLTRLALCIPISWFFQPKSFIILQGKKLSRFRRNSWNFMKFEFEIKPFPPILVCKFVIGTFERSTDWSISLISSLIMPLCHRKIYNVPFHIKKNSKEGRKNRISKIRTLAWHHCKLSIQKMKQATLFSAAFSLS